jgi:hypothetical protein
MKLRVPAMIRHSFGACQTIGLKMDFQRAVDRIAVQEEIRRIQLDAFHQLRNPPDSTVEWGKC